MAKRIEFIDLAKGVCIIWVILWHVHIMPVYIPGFNSVRMPLYFILSGLFFKTYGGFKELVIKKTNKILIPFLFFYLTGYLIYYSVNLIAPGLIKTEANSILDVFTQRQYFNGPIWFLLSLFWANLIYCLISINIKSGFWRGIIVCAISLVGLILGKKHIFLPMMVDNAMTALFFFWLGSLLKHTQLLYPNRFDRYNLLIALGFYIIAFAIDKLFSNPCFELSCNVVNGNVVMVYAVSVASVMSLLFICKTVRYLPFVSYFGRYSIIPLCVHHLIYRPIALVVSKVLPSVHFAEWQGAIVAISTILLCWACIPICRKYLPYFTAQKDLIKA